MIESPDCQNHALEAPTHGDSKGEDFAAVTPAISQETAQPHDEGMKGVLPVSSRSFHAFERDAMEKLYGIQGAVDWNGEELRDELNAIRGELSQTRALAEHAMLLLWELYRNDGEAHDDAHKRLFENLPKATGGLRLLQQANTALLRDFDELCAEHGIRYWVAFGTALGAFRHKGFIPWDDDLDVCLPRQDLQTLRQAVEADDRFCITTVYDWYAKCRQIRFKYADESLPCFIDLFSMDFSRASAEDAGSELTTQSAQLRAELSSNKFAFWADPANRYLPEDDPRTQDIDNAFSHAVESIKCIDCPEPQATKIFYGIDNGEEPALVKCDWMACDVKDVLPTTRVSFEGITINAPADIDKHLTSYYGDYLQLPMDIASHYQHVNHDELQAGPTRDVLARLLRDSGVDQS